MTAAELADWYQQQTDDNRPLLPPAPQTVDADWRLNWE